ncbi:extracellular solute-binding protein [Halalkalibacter kiskunsagensis]|uniref:Extracellular solute-binding protein n=1 Tax=Halalkalibacter kiskunsagensis TaxID=1548599 RepID=A0ABV6KFR7_9BACI
MKKSALLIFGLLLIMVLAACSGGGSEETSTNEEAESNEGATEETVVQDEDPTEVRIMSHFFSPTPPSSDNLVLQEIEKVTNTKLNVEWVSANNYADRFNVILASGNLPDLMLVPDPFSPVFKRAAEQGAFWDVSPYIDDYPNLKEGIADIAWELTQIDGANYGIPRPRPSEGETFFIIRKDWLDNVGLEMPTTSDELYEVMKAFANEDPNNSGKDDTYGMVGYVNPEDMGDMGSYEGMFTGVNGEWKEENGELTHVAFLPETRDALEYLANAYADGLIPEDFASLQVSQVKDMFKAGRAGIINEKAGAMQEYYDHFSQVDPDFEFTNLMPVTSINDYNPAGPGFAGANVISKSVPEVKMKQILQMMDRWMEDDVFSLHRHGIEGVHHTVENGEIVIDTEKMTSDAVGDHNQIVYVSDPYASSVKPTFPEDVQQLYKEIQDERENTSVANISLGLFSETGVNYLPELRKDIQDLKTVIILGREPITAWDAFVEKLKENPQMQALTAEINESYSNR